MARSNPTEGRESKVGSNYSMRIQDVCPVCTINNTDRKKALQVLQTTTTIVMVRYKRRSVATRDRLCMDGTVQRVRCPSGKQREYVTEPRQMTTVRRGGRPRVPGDGREGERCEWVIHEMQGNMWDGEDDG